MTMASVSGSGPAELEAARLVLARMGIVPADLLGESNRPSTVPTFAAYVPLVSEAVGSGSRRAYSSYWKKIVAKWGDRRLDEPTTTEIQRQVEDIRATAVVRSNTRDGRSAGENYIAALRCIYNHAIADNLITEAANPARKVGKPRRLPSTRRAVPDTRLAEINEVARTTGNDPELDSLILRLHTETAARRGGGLDLRPIDLDSEQCLIRLREKGDTVRWQPVSPTLMTHLKLHAQERPAPPTTRLLRYPNGHPITHRRYDHLWERIGQHLAWVATQQISNHWLRHTTLTWVERNFGYAVARAYAGHNDSASDATTTTYVRATIHEIAAAVAALTGEDHPLTSTEHHLQ
jgi:integrase/recombinase XerC